MPADLIFQTPARKLVLKNLNVIKHYAAARGQLLSHAVPIVEDVYPLPIDRQQHANRLTGLIDRTE